MKHVTFAAFLAVSGQGAFASCSDTAVTVIGDFGQARFKVNVADTNETRARGLMFVEEMSILEGMLFVYDGPVRATFWMKNTLIPLDMLFADETGTIVTLHENAVPGDETTIDGGEGVLAVLEINGGVADRLGIEVGDVLQHPVFGDAAEAPCE
ncbi:hypothetical protein SAMN04488515_1266 [Cognatiyoonia koreensis]|uniref:DUF192 domain-containing protein n=1 Tax=Cognatiyoonia koreensis TaxID=364200 RepID=A0A1I0PJJ1_9RHOB|nr:DUF192 domain-containing protein [Cognatiyoonia koreensis]SEW14529.1 hypothetical protein SAMN04488515_1266 [Cognatiyoonia koreensis]